jgi:hypothetical protein
MVLLSMVEEVSSLVYDHAINDGCHIIPTDIHEVHK